MILLGIHDSFWANERSMQAVRASEPHWDRAVHSFRPPSEKLCSTKLMLSTVGFLSGFPITLFLFVCPALVSARSPIFVFEKYWAKIPAEVPTFCSPLSFPRSLFAWTILYDQNNGDKGRKKSWTLVDQNQSVMLPTTCFLLDWLLQEPKEQASPLGSSASSTMSPEFCLCFYGAQMDVTSLNDLWNSVCVLPLNKSPSIFGTNILFLLIISLHGSGNYIVVFFPLQIALLVLSEFQDSFELIYS